MSEFNRRDFLKLTGAATLAGALPLTARREARAEGVGNFNVVVVGAGFGGATVAKYLRLWSKANPNLNLTVTLVDPRAGTTTAVTNGLYNDGYYSPILSNGVVTGQFGMSRIYINYRNLQNVHGVVLKQGSATRIEPIARTVTVSLTNGATEVLPYDRLVLSPGIGFISPNANQPDYLAATDTWSPDLTPHAWVAGQQTVLLQKQLQAMTSKGLFIMTVPKSPYRCPPGPYERACVVADWLMRNRSGARILVLDQNPGIQAEPVNFGNAFTNRYKSVLTYQSGVIINRVNSSQKRIETNIGTWDSSTVSSLGKVQVLNVIPNQKAGEIIFNAFGPGQSLPLDASGRWASIDPLNYASVGYPDIHIIGDAQASMPPKVTPPGPVAAQPKSGTMANSQAKVCADAILRSFDPANPYPDPHPTTNSACYSPISSKDASWLNANYQYNPSLGIMQRVDGSPGGTPDPAYNSFGEADQVSGDNLEAMYIWADNLFADAMK